MATLQKICFWLLILQCNSLFAQVKWLNVDSLFQQLPYNFHVYKTTDSLDGKPFVAYYAAANLKDRKLNFTTDTTFKRRLTPQQFYLKNNQPLLVVNGTFFSFETNQNLNVVIKKGRVLAYNVHSFAGKGKDTLTYSHPFGSAIGVDKKRRADVAWVLTDSSRRTVYALNKAYVRVIKDSIQHPSFGYLKHSKIYFKEGSFTGAKYISRRFKKWKMISAIGGGPVLVQNGKIYITNNEELKFTGKSGLTDKHPRTAMGYTLDGKWIVLVVEGRNPKVADGATLPQLAKILMDIGCDEAINLDGGGSSCMLINGKETIKPSDKTGQRAVPAVFIIK